MSRLADVEHGHPMQNTETAGALEPRVGIRAFTVRALFVVPLPPRSELDEDPGAVVLDSARRQLLEASFRAGRFWEACTLAPGEVATLAAIGPAVDVLFGSSVLRIDHGSDRDPAPQADAPEHNWFAMTNDAIQSTLRRRSLTLRIAGESAPLGFAASRPVELFLAESGHAVLSVRFEWRRSDDAAAPSLDVLEQLQRFVYECSLEDPDRGVRLHDAHLSPSPVGGGGNRDGSLHALEARLLRGGEIRLAELPSLLLPWALGAGMGRGPDRSSLGRVGVYSVLEVDAGGRGLSDPALRRWAEGIATRLAGAFAPSHPLAPEDVTIVPRVVLTERHLAAAGALGAGHVLLDEPSPVDRGTAAHGQEGFDPARFHRANTRYFAPYLLAMHQRWFAHDALLRAGRTASMMREHRRRGDARSSESHAAAQRLVELHAELLEHRMSTDLVQVSAVENVNRWYDAARLGLGVAAELSRLREALSDAADAIAVGRGERIAQELAANVENTRKAQEEIAKTQAKLEWVEVILVTTYVVELYFIGVEVTHIGLPWSAWIVGCSAFLGLFAAMWLLRPARDSEGDSASGGLGAALRGLSRDRRMRLLFALTVLLVALLVIGTWGHAPAVAH